MALDWKATRREREAVLGKPRKPTSEQLTFLNNLRKRTGIDLPAPETAADASLFIDQLLDHEAGAASTGQ